MRIRDWSSDVCSSDLFRHHLFGLAVNLGDKRAGGVQIFKTARRRGFRHRFRYAMRRKDDGEIVRKVVQMLDEDGSLCLQPIHHIAVMPRSEERRVGKESVSTGNSRWWQVHSKKKKTHKRE